MYWGRNYLTKFGGWYAIEVPGKWWRAMQNLSGYIVEMFGIKINLQYLWVPMFQDKSGVGRFLSLAFRLVFIFGGGLVWFLAHVVGMLFLPFWFGFHLVWLISWELGVVWWIVLGALYGVRVLSGRAWEYVEGEYSWEKLLNASDDWMAELLAGYPENVEEWWSNGKVKWWLARIGLVDAKGWKLLSLDLSREELGRRAWQSAVHSGGVTIEPGDVLLALAQGDIGFITMLDEVNLKMEDVWEVVLWVRREQVWWGTFPIWDPRFEVKEGAGFNRAKTGVVTPALDQYSVDLTAVAGSLPTPVGRKEAYERLLGILGRSSGENAMILGETGIGKTTFVGGLAKMIMEGNAPGAISNKRLVRMEPGRLMAGAKSDGELAGRLVALLDDVKRSKDIILFVDEVQTMVSGGNSNLLSILEEALENSHIQVIATTTQRYFKQYVEPNGGFAGMFSVMTLEEPTDEEARMILENMTAGIEKSHGVVVSWPALQAAIRLTRQYMSDQVLPAKGKRVLDEAGVRLSKSGQGYILAEDVAVEITNLTGIPVSALNDDEREKLLKLEDQIHERFVGQDLAVGLVADALRRARLAVRNRERPIGTFMFVGPTGVGKTELSRQLARVYFGSEDAMIRFDMSEFSQISMLSRLVGAPVGTAGHELGGELTESVRRRPFSLLLLDEIEKAHPQVWDLLMQVIDEGRLTDASGLTVDFRHTIVICTSNAVTTYIQEKLREGVPLDQVQEGIFEQMTKTFRVEFLNRFDGIVPFAPLSGNQMESVVRLELEKLVVRLREKRVEVTYTEGLVRAIAGRAEVRDLGARPVRRLIQDKLEAYIAMQLLRISDPRGEVIELGEEVLG